MNINRYIPGQTAFEYSFNYITHIDFDKYKNVGIIHWWWLSEKEAQLENLKQFVESQDICFFVSEEIFARHDSIDINKVFEILNSHNVYYILFSHDLTLSVQPNPAKTFYSPWFFKSPLYVPSNYAPDLDYVEKTYTFNLMLGSRKSYRTIAYKILKDNRAIYSKYLGHPDFKFDNVPNLDNDELYTNLISQDVARHKLNTMNFLEKEGREYPISHVIPEKIYANTHFDIVTETFVKQQNMFITEKTAKPLATGRFFCWFNSNNVVDHLEKFGFAFAHYWAEYDKIRNDLDRLNAMLELVEEISNNPLCIKDIYKKSRNVRIHNMNVFKQQTEQFQNRITEWMIDCLSR
jgi:hypothetical protein